MRRLILALVVLLGVSGLGMAGTYISTTSLTVPQPVGVENVSAATFYAPAPGWCGNWECAYGTIGGYGVRQAQVCIQDSYGYTFSCRTFYTSNTTLTYSSLSQAYTCLPSRSWFWVSGLGTKVSSYVDLC